jgi:putative hydrolase of the HAD superfamily
MIRIPIRNIYFDWSGTLAKPGLRDIFLHGETRKERLNVLYPDTLELLDYLNRRGYIIGIITNTSKSKESFMKALEETGMSKYFRGSIVTSSEPEMCKKGCSLIFQTALIEDNVEPEDSLYIGNNFDKDIIGSMNAGLYGIWINRTEKSNSYPFQVRQLCELKEVL